MPRVKRENKENDPTVDYDDGAYNDGDEEYLPKKKTVKKSTAGGGKAKGKAGNLKKFNGKFRFGNAIKSKISKGYIKDGYAIKADCHFSMPCPMETFRELFAGVASEITPLEFSEETPVVLVQLKDFEAITKVFDEGKLLKSTTVTQWNASKMDVVFMPPKQEISFWWIMDSKCVATCFKCRQTGHMSQNCPNRNSLLGFAVSLGYRPEMSAALKQMSEAAMKRIEAAREARVVGKSAAAAADLEDSAGANTDSTAGVEGIN